jgi:hypothetical protein
MSTEEPDEDNRVEVGKRVKTSLYVECVGC